jgi:ABC-type nitrate/sulfonate/bicarbonate transport system permease component
MAHQSNATTEPELAPLPGEVSHGSGVRAADGRPHDDEPGTSRRGLMAWSGGARWAVSIGSVALFLVAWQVYASHISPLLLVPPTAIVTAFGQLIGDGELAQATIQSLEVLFVGFLIGLSLAIPIGLVWARFRVVDWAIQPFVSALFSTPLVALVPLYVLWFGFGFEAKIAIVASFTFFPVLLNTYQGATAVDPMHLDVAKVFKATERQTWRHVVLPSALPFVVAGLNVSLGHALTGLVISEFYTNASGLGGIVLTASGTFQTAKMFVPIVIIVALGITLMAGTRWLQGRLAPWAVGRNSR